MAKLSNSSISHIADLSKLTLTDAEVKKLTIELSQTIKFVDNLNEIDTSKVIPTNQVTGLENVFRGDLVIPFMNPELCLPKSSNTYNNYFKVKAVINKTTL